MFQGYVAAICPLVRNDTFVSVQHQLGGYFIPASCPLNFNKLNLMGHVAGTKSLPNWCCRDFNIFSSHGLLPSDLVAQSVERGRSNPKVVGSIPTLVRVFLCPCVGPVPSVGLTLS